MCGPWALPLALIVAGSGAKFIGNKQAQSAQSRRFQAEQTRQRGLTDQQQGLFEASLAKTRGLQNPDEQDRATSARDRSLQAIIAPAEADASYLPGVRSASPVVHTAADRAAGAQHAESSGLATALARLAGFGDQILDTNIQSGRNAGRIGQLGTFKAGSAGVLDSELQAAAHKGSFLRGVGGLAQQVGMSMAGNVGGGGGGGFMGTVVPKASLGGTPNGGSIDWLKFFSSSGPFARGEF